MASLITLVVSLIIGMGLRFVKTLPTSASSTIGTLILYVPLPAMCLLSLPDLEWNVSLISLGLVTWIIFGIAYFLFNFLGTKRGWDKGLVGCLILTAGFCNSAFVGFPVINALYGPEALKLAIFLDQSGSFLIVSSFGLWVALTYSSGKMRKRVLLKKILLFPPFLAFISGLSLGILGWRATGITREVLENLASILTPLALIAVGLQLHWSAIKEEKKYLTLGLSFKLFLAPFIIFSLYLLAGVPLNIFNVAVLESAMAPMVTSSILATSYQLRPQLANMMLGVGVPLSFLTLTFWYWILTYFNPTI